MWRNTPFIFIFWGVIFSILSVPNHIGLLEKLLNKITGQEWGLLNLFLLIAGISMVAWGIKLSLKGDPAKNYQQQEPKKENFILRILVYPVIWYQHCAAWAEADPVESPMGILKRLILTFTTLLSAVIIMFLFSVLVIHAITNF